MSTKTYADFRTDFLHDESGKMLWGEHLFLNIYHFWFIRRDGFLLGDYKKNSLLKKVMRKKVRTTNLQDFIKDDSKRKRTRTTNLQGFIKDDSNRKGTI